MKNCINKILVTGGAGYVGAVLVPKLLKKGYEVSVVDWFIYGEVFEGIGSRVKGKVNKGPGSSIQGPGNRLKCVRGDIRDGDLLKRELEGFDAVIHLACISNDPSFELDPGLGKSVNYDATIMLGKIAKEAGVKRFVYASTSSVYGVKDEENVTEDLSLEPLTDYSKYKAEGEKYLFSLNSIYGSCRSSVPNYDTSPFGSPSLTSPVQSNKEEKFHVLVFRPATVCGFSPRMRLDLTVNMLTMHALVNRRIRVFGGIQKRPNIHIEDMTDLYVKSLGYPDEKIAGKIFNAGYENHTVMEIARMVKKVVGDEGIEIAVEPTDDIRSYHINSDKIRKELGFVPKHTVEEAIRDIVKAYRKGLLPNPFTDEKYFNIKMMKKVRMK